MLLLHICCAHCLAKTLNAWRAEINSSAIAGFFFNPNIHPLQEFRKRLRALEIYLERDPLNAELEASYGLSSFCRAIHPNYLRPERCRICYRLRLMRTAQRAAEMGCDAFTTTMVASCHQDHALLRAEGEAAANTAGVGFVYRDLRDAAVDAKLTRSLYRQQYCGCVFSEAERYAGEQALR